MTSIAHSEALYGHLDDYEVRLMVLWCDMLQFRRRQRSRWITLALQSLRRWHSAVEP